MSEVVIVASAFGVESIRRDGHRAWLAVAATAGAAGFEVRRELFASDDQAAPRALQELGAAITALGMWPVYSTPAALYSDDGTLDTAALKLALNEAQALGARFVKLQLGGFADRPQTAELAACLSGEARPRLLVENGQLRMGGSLAQFAALFDVLDRDGQPDLVGMTFDIGNWRWPGEDPIEAAKQLARRVEYVHCKAVTGEGARRFAVAPAADDPLCAAVLPLLPHSVPRGIEFPFDTTRVAADASHYVAWLANAAQPTARPAAQPTARPAAQQKETP
ncbi:sugar phosphate isomerase/epimerase family protein [Paraburkholderia sp.]|uniref:sugar phosphate isomerase/epimerase family protein n=1 Tax=Paraburkholderia sp. TaxID=1926495 RepID=UPI003D6F5E6E